MIGSQFSTPQLLNVGSPQGAILSPTIFIILVADIGLWSSAFVSGYADDTTATVHDEDLEKVVEKCEREADNILRYMSINRLKANPSKTHILVIRRNGWTEKEKITFRIGEEQVEESNNEILLGLSIKNDLTWSEHLRKLNRELNSRLFILRRLAQSLPKELLKRVADGIFISKLRYGLPLYCPIRLKAHDPEPSVLTNIKVTFNNMLRLLTSNRRKDHVSIDSMLKELGWLSINQLCIETRLTEAWKSINEENHPLKPELEIKEAKMSMCTRSIASKNFEMEKPTYKKLSQNSFSNPTKQAWNQAPICISEAKTLAEAKRQIRKFVITLPM